MCTAKAFVFIAKVPGGIQGIRQKTGVQNDERQYIVPAFVTVFNRPLPQRKRLSVKLPVVDVHRDFKAKTHITIAGFAPLHGLLLLGFARKSRGPSARPFVPI